VALGQGVMAAGEAPQEAALRRGFAQILVHLVALKAKFPAANLELALRLFEAAANEIAPGAPERVLLEELVAEKLAVFPSSEALERVAERLGFVVPKQGPDRSIDQSQPPDRDRGAAKAEPSGGTGREVAVAE
jgi:hypothetical protein